MKWLHQMLMKNSSLMHSTVGGYLFAAAITCAGILLRTLLIPILGTQESYTVLFPTIVLIALLFGFWPAVVIGFAGTLIVEYYLIPPLGILLDAPTITRTSLMLLACVIVGSLSKRRQEFAQKARDQAHQLTVKTDELESVIRIVSHDLRAPLTNISGFSKEIARDIQLLSDMLCGLDLQFQGKKAIPTILSQSIPESLTFIQASAHSMSNLVESLVKVARAGLVVPKPEMLEMTELIKTVVDSIKIKIKESNTIITMEDLPPCFADRNHTIQIFTNLIDNAVKYLAAERQGQISIEAKIEKDTVIYCVMDNGIGIAREHQEKIFDTYYRIVEKKSVGGEGIGLSVVKGMVERNNGRIWLESEKGKGSKFCVRLPKSSSKKL